MYEDIEVFLEKVDGCCKMRCLGLWELFIYERVKRKVIKLLIGKFDEVDRIERDVFLSEL